MNAIEISNLKKDYHNGHTALQGVNLTVKKGDFFALLGANGAGKSTTIGIICSLINKTAGTIKIDNHDIDHEPYAAKSLLGIVPQEVNICLFEKCIDIIVNQGGYYGVPKKLALERAEKYMNQLGIWEKRNAYSRSLSGGLKRRLMIARGLIHEPKILILDEPTAGVDVELRRSTWDFLTDLNNQGITILLTTHYLEEAEQLCKNIAIIDDGKIIKDTSLKTLLYSLHKETFILDLEAPCESLPNIPAYPLKLVDKLTIEAEIKRDSNINDLFMAFSKQNIYIKSIRSKSNRLEELFLGLIEEAQS